MVHQTYRLTLSIFFAFFVSTTVTLSRDIGTANVVVGSVFGRDIMKGMKSGEMIFFDQKIKTGNKSAATLEFLDNTRLTVSERAEMLLDEMVYDPRGDTMSGLVKMSRGLLRFSSNANSANMKFKTQTATIGIRGTNFDMFISGGKTELAVASGKIKVDSRFGSKTVSKGQIFSVSGSSASFSKKKSKKFETATTNMLKMIPEQKTKSKVKGDKSALQKYLIALNTAVIDNTMFLNVDGQKILIELSPNSAPKHVKQVKNLMKKGFYNGLHFHRIEKGFIAETGDPTGTGTGGSGSNLAAEFSNANFLKGSVGMTRKPDDVNSADSQFFILLGDAKHLNGKYTYIGKVIYGMEFVEKFPAGAPPKDLKTIKQSGLMSK